MCSRPWTSSCSSLVCACCHMFEDVSILPWWIPSGLVAVWKQHVNLLNILSVSRVSVTHHHHFYAMMASFQPASSIPDFWEEETFVLSGNASSQASSACSRGRRVTVMCSKCALAAIWSKKMLFPDSCRLHCHDCTPWNTTYRKQWPWELQNQHF